MDLIERDLIERGLVERDREVAALRTVVDAAVDGRGQAAGVWAPAGGGKTAVLRAVSRSAADRGVAVLWAAGVEQEAVIPYGVVHQLIDPLVRRDPSLVAAGPAGRAWRQLERGAEADPTLSRGLHWLLADATDGRPSVVVVDDLHWADRPSAAFVAYLIRRLATMPVAVLLATRDPSSFDDLPTPVDLARVDLAPLTHHGVGVVARRVGLVGDEVLGEEVVGAVHRATGGNPFLVQEALTALAEHPELPADRAVSTDLVASVRRRLRALDPHARQVAHVLAVAGASPPPHLVADVAGVEAATVLACADQLVACHLTTSVAGLTLRHPLLRSAVLESLPEGQRAVLHRRTADALGRHGAPVGDVGHHLLRTFPQADRSVARRLGTAGRAALDNGDPHTAVLLLERAIAEPPAEEDRAELVLLLGTARQRIGDERAVDDLRWVLTAAVAPEARMAAMRGLLAALLSFARLDELDETLVGELRRTERRTQRDDRDAVVRLEAEVLSAARHALHATLWNADRLRRWRGRVSGATPAERVLLADLATQAALDGEPAAHAVELARAALRGHRLVDEQTADSLTVYQPIWQLTAADELVEARAALAAAFVDAHQRGSIVGYALASLFSSYVDVAQGDLLAAESHAHAALTAAEQLPASWMVLPAVVAAAVDVHVERGMLEPSVALLERHGLAGPLHDSVPHRLLLYSRARLQQASGQTASAVRDADELVRRQRTANVLSAHLVPGRAVAALAHAQAGDLALAVAFAEENLRLATAWGTPRIVGRALLVRARVQPPSEAFATLGRAVDELGRAPAPLDLAWARLHRATTSVRLGYRSEAIADLRAALDVAAAAGATALERASRQSLVSLGLRPRRSAATGLDALTVSERQVVDLAALGRTNRDIAAALFVAPRTVEAHLTSAYRKLGIRRRAELAAALGPRS